MADTDENKETNLPDCPDSFCLHSISHCNENVDEENENKLMILQEKISQDYRYCKNDSISVSMYMIIYK